MRPMRRRIGQVEEKGLFLATFLDELDSVIREGIGRVIRSISSALYSHHRFITGKNTSSSTLVGIRKEEAAGTGNATIDFFKAALQRPARLVMKSQVPFPGQISCITR